MPIDRREPVHPLVDALLEETMTAERLHAIAKEAQVEFGEAALAAYGDAFRKFITAAKQAKDAGMAPELIEFAARTFGDGLEDFGSRVDDIMDKIAGEVGFTKETT